jgi:hypothetical protein
MVYFKLSATDGSVIQNMIIMSSIHDNDLDLFHNRLLYSHLDVAVIGFTRVVDG